MSEDLTAVKKRVSKELIEALNKSDFNDEELSEAVELATLLEQKGHKPKRYFPIGILAPDSIGIDYDLGDSETLKTLLGEIIVDPRINGTPILINGIRVNDIGHRINDGLTLRVGLKR